MAQPRFLFICSYPAKSRVGVGAASGSMTTLTSTSTSAAAAASATSELEHVAWRLLGANNRELGRSPLWYPDMDSCREAVRLLKREIDGVTSAITAVTLPGGCVVTTSCVAVPATTLKPLPPIAPLSSTGRTL